MELHSTKWSQNFFLKYSLLFYEMGCHFTKWVFNVGITVSPHVCFILDLILISMFLV